MTLVHLALCAVAAGLCWWRGARAVAMALGAVLGAGLASLFWAPWPWGLGWQLVGPVACVAAACWTFEGAPQETLARQARVSTGGSQR